MIFHEFSADGKHALVVAISRRGVHVLEIAEIGGCFDSPEATYLAKRAALPWREFRARDRCYSGDDGSGCLRQRIVAGAISAIASRGGDHVWLVLLESAEVIGLLLGATRFPGR